MARKSFEEFVSSIASATDDAAGLIKADPEILRIYRGTEPYQNRIDSACSYWRGRSNYWQRDGQD